MIYKATIIVTETNTCNLLVLMREAHVEVASIFLGSGLTVDLTIISSTYSNSVGPNSDMVGFVKRELDSSLVKTHSMHCKCSKIKDD